MGLPMGSLRSLGPSNGMSHGIPLDVPWDPIRCTMGSHRTSYGMYRGRTSRGPFDETCHISWDFPLEIPKEVPCKWNFPWDASWAFHAPMERPMGSIELPIELPRGGDRSHETTHEMNLCTYGTSHGISNEITHGCIVLPTGCIELPMGLPHGTFPYGEFHGISYRMYHGNKCPRELCAPMETHEKSYGKSHGISYEA